MKNALIAALVSAAIALPAAGAATATMSESTQTNLIEYLVKQADHQKDVNARLRLRLQVLEARADHNDEADSLTQDELARVCDLLADQEGASVCLP